MSARVIILILLFASPAFTQTTVYTNKDAGGNRHPDVIFELELTTVPRLATAIPPSIIRAAQEGELLAEFQHWTREAMMRPSPSFEYDAQWPFTYAVNLPRRRVVYEPTYYGNFVPLTPYGPLVNPNLFQTNSRSVSRSGSARSPVRGVVAR